MKNRILPRLVPVFTALMLVGGLTQCTGKTVPASSTPGTSVPAPSDQADAIVYVEGMTWGGCSAQIEGDLASLAGIKDSSFDYKTGKGEVWFNADTDAPTEDELKASIDKSGFTATKIEFRNAQP